MFKRDKSKIIEAFHEIEEKLQYKAKWNYECCQSCAGVGLADEFEEEGVPEDEWYYVYTHEQDMEVFNNDGDLMRTLNIKWNGDKEKIAKILEDKGLDVKVPETDMTTIQILA